MGIGLHTDFECFTLLAQQTDTDTDGLRAMALEPWPQSRGCVGTRTWCNRGCVRLWPTICDKSRSLAEQLDVQPEDPIARAAHSR